MKPFDLEKAKAGAPVITRNGSAARIICFNRADADNYPLVALLHLGEGIERVTTHTDQGHYCKEPGNNCDLFMAPVKREGWVNIYPNDSTGVAIHPSRSLADKSDVHKVRIDCIHIEWLEE